MPARETTNGEPLLVQVNQQPHGSFYALEFLSQRRIRELFPEVHGLPSVFFGFNKEDEFESLHRPLWPLAAKLLTGLTEDQIARVGGVRFYNPWTKEVVWEWHLIVTANK
jgi:hypothetical protein